MEAKDWGWLAIVTAMIGGAAGFVAEDLSEKGAEMRRLDDRLRAVEITVHVHEFRVEHQGAAKEPDE